MKNKRDVDFINPRVIMDSIQITGKLRQEIVNESLMHATVPDIYKLSTVRPEPKKTRPKLTVSSNKNAKYTRKAARDRS